MSEINLNRRPDSDDRDSDSADGPHGSKPPEGFLSPDVVADLYLALLTPEKVQPKPPEQAKDQEQKFDWGGKQIVLKSRNGQSTYFKDETGEWDSKDGELWIRRKSSENDVWRGRIQINSNGVLVEESHSSGITSSRFKDGSSERSIQTTAGVELKTTKAADGTLEYQGASGKWISKDAGKSWTSGQNTFNGQLGIDDYGRYWRQPDGRAKEIVERSRETKLIETKISEIEKKYNVQFGAAGTEYTYDFQDPATDSVRKIPIYFRLPTSRELDVMETCLKQYAHVVPELGGNPNFDGMRINFISGQGEATKLGLWGWYQRSEAGKSQVYFGPGNARSSEGWDGLKGTALHEIGHHLQHKNWTTLGKREVPKSVSDFFGFVQDKNGTENYRLQDKDGGVWDRHTIRAKDKEGNWYYKGGWYPVIGGVPVHEESRVKTNAELRAKIADDKKPCTDYFTNPAEAHAEAMSMMLFEPRMLWDRNQKLYEATRQWDQADINGRHGLVKDADGKLIPKMMRSADGLIVPNDAEQRKKLEQLEKGWRAAPVTLNIKNTWMAVIERRAATQRDCCL